MTSEKRAVAALRRPDRRRGEGSLRQAAHPRQRVKSLHRSNRRLNNASRQLLRPSVPVVVDDAKCIADKGCTVCVDVCPLDVLRISDMTGKAYMAYDECWYCMPCEADCPTGAVTVNIPYLLR